MNNIAVGGATVASALVTLQERIRYINRKAVAEHILLNFGVNDANGIDFSDPAEVAAWVADYESMIDQLHTAFPAAVVYITRPWRRTLPMATWNNVAAAIDTIIADYPGLVSAGDDERVWLEGGDNGVTMTSDGTHYSAAGQVEKKNQMMTVLGF